MEIKRFQNLWTMGLLLCGAILLILYLAKLIIPQWVIGVAHLPSIVAIGEYIDTHDWAWYLTSAVVSFVSYYLMCCACAGKTKLPLADVITILVVLCMLFVIRECSSQWYPVFNLFSTLLLPVVTKGSFKKSIVYFAILNTLQVVTLAIREINTMITSPNFATLFVLMIDVYIFQLLFYFYQNYKKEVKKDGNS